MKPELLSRPPSREKHPYGVRSFFFFQAEILTCFLWRIQVMLVIDVYHHKICQTHTFWTYFFTTPTSNKVKIHQKSCFIELWTKNDEETIFYDQIKRSSSVFIFSIIPLLYTQHGCYRTHLDSVSRVWFTPPASLLVYLTLTVRVVMQ